MEKLELEIKSLTKKVNELQTNKKETNSNLETKTKSMIKQSSKLGPNEFKEV